MTSTDQSPCPRFRYPEDFDRARNPLIADLLHRIGFIEMAGDGIRRIRDEARDLGCPEPEFAVDSFVTVTFRPNPAVRPVAEQVTVEVTGEAASPL